MNREYFLIRAPKSHDFVILDFVLDTDDFKRFQYYVGQITLAGCYAHRLGFADFFRYNLRFFWTYRIGAVSFNLGSCFPVSPSRFFKKGFLKHYVCSEHISSDGLSSSTVQKVLRCVQPEHEDGTLPLR